MSATQLESIISAAFDARETVSNSTKGEVREAVDHALELLDDGKSQTEVGRILGVDQATISRLAARVVAH